MNHTKNGTRITKKRNKSNDPTRGVYTSTATDESSQVYTRFNVILLQQEEKTELNCSNRFHPDHYVIPRRASKPTTTLLRSIEIQYKVQKRGKKELNQIHHLTVSNESDRQRKSLLLFSL